MSAVAIGIVAGLALLGMQFVLTRPGAQGKLVEGRYRVEGGPLVTWPLVAALVALVSYRFGCLFAYQCEPMRLDPMNIPADIFAAFVCGVCLIAMKRGEISYDDDTITIGRVFGSPETIRWSDIQNARWIGRYGELLLVWEGGTRSFHYWWRGAPGFVESLRSRGINVPGPPRPFKTA
jgi:hypothetical protein